MPETETPARRRQAAPETPTRRTLAQDIPARTPTGTATAAVTATNATGWAAAKEVLAQGGSFTNAMEIGTEVTVVGFLEPEPFDAFREHWFPELEGKKGFRCLTEDCPLCQRLGHKADAVRIDFNVLSYANPKEPSVEVLRAGATLGRALEDLAEDPRYEGLDDPRLHVGVYKLVDEKSKNKKPVYHTREIKTRDLLEDYGIVQPPAEQLAWYRTLACTEPIDQKPTWRELDDLADKLLT